MLAASLAAASAEAAFVLDTGIPDNSKLPLLLDGNDFAAAEFALTAGQTLTSIEGFIKGGSGSNAGDTFTIAIYAADGSAGLPGTVVTSLQGSYQADGWNGLNNLNISGFSTGNYWVAFEVGGGDTATDLQLPIVATNGSVPAAAYAFNAGGGYHPMSGENFGVQIAAVPLPAAAWLFASALGGFSVVRRRT